ncbi:uncharacterized protein ATC70_000308 [Mucor velutinosus]|uniref:Reticulon-like protein n=1 Tax=Mucor velutinosus TaxID=708070 RepID=A0AAN7HTY1_9FUNG|nr:hypothetical protein ATC70_000308 [Mucor velutinosus]
MDSYAIHQQRPITPPNDRNKAQVPVMGDIQNKGQMPFERQGEESSLSDLSHLSKLNTTSAMPPVSTAPSVPSATAASANPFISSHQEDLNKPSILSDIPSQSTRRAQRLDDPFNDIRSASAPSSASNTNYLSSDSLSSSKYGSGRNDTTHRIENEVLNILKWKNPVRSGSIFALIVGSIILTRWYSLLQIGSSLLTIAIGVNLIYVNFIMQGQKLVSSNQDASHPYNNVIHNEKHTMIDKQSVRHYSTVLTEVSETLIRALTRIVFVENTATSIKWMSIFFVIWKVSAHVSTMDIVLAVVISAFIFPRLYISNKDVVDAQIHKGQTLIQNGIEKAQNAATTAAQDTYTKSRAAFAKAGTTGTDAKNTMSKESVTIKED